MTSWTVEFSPRAAKELRKLDRPVQKRIVAYLREISASLRRVVCFPDF
ncbi:type II toxin-antitoxin system RelE family toxin [Corynebacterium rouxii]|uniref:Type II toxin-antitoxin system RelE/ParE family toxin n=1 Tax=Corynebacterium rouxii TaxID=2719119 RepID=A0ABU3PQ72_9CORY|nr:hypothetical protein [Corynebacterium rouxii]MDT9409736.1 hypothetical protein [Corynebacterium rouxii]MDT9411969.1 hypothetical protein [Corynebacterium rouxii]